MGPEAKVIAGAIIALATLLGAFVFGRLDPDRGGYTDGWRTRAAFPDKAVHAVVAYALALTIGVLLWWWLGLLVTLVAGYIFEWSSGAVKRKVWKYDFYADTIGAILGTLVVGVTLLL